MITGIIRKLDKLGRITPPKEARRTLAIEPGDPVEMYVEDGELRVKPVRLHCACCGADEKQKRLFEKNGVLMCKECIEEFSIIKGQ